MSTKEFCKRLRLAKAQAVRRFDDGTRLGIQYCIFWGCSAEGLFLDSIKKNAVFSHPSNCYSHEWVRDNVKTTADIARVFDESIVALGEQP